MVHTSNRILLFFDASKLDISDELKSFTDLLKGQYDKTRCIINKADCISTQRLLRVHGAVMWSLAKLFERQSKPLRVYIGS